MHIPEQYGYANQVLDEQNVQIFQGNNRILEKRHQFTFKKVKNPETIINTIDVAVNPERDLMQVDYNTLLGYGYKIGVRYAHFVNSNQRISTLYFLCKRNKNAPNYDGIPPNHKVLIDRNDWLVRLEGPNVPNLVGEWHQISNYYLDKEKLLPAVEKNMMNLVAQQSEDILGELTGQLSRVKRVTLKIGEIPFMGTGTGDLICFPKSEDPQTIGIFGKRGEGKSYVFHRLLNLYHYKYGVRSVIMNDLTGETAAWCKPWYNSPNNGEGFVTRAIRELELRGESPVPMPIAYLHPEKNPALTGSDMKHPHESGFKISIPFREFVRDFDTLLRGNEVWTLGKSGRYFRSIVKHLSDDLIIGDYDSFVQEIKDTFKVMSSDGGERVPDGVQSKILSILDDFYNAGILDVSNGISATVKVKAPYEEWETYPWLALMKYGVIPDFQMSGIRDKAWFPQYFRFINDSIINAQNSHPLFKTGVVMQYIDELQGIASRDKPNAASESIEQTFSEGRNKRIGVVYCAQNYEVVPEKVATNTHYALVFRQADAGLAKLKKDFEELNTRGWNATIKGLKRFHCVAVTDEHYVRYRADGLREESIGPFEGTILPPLSTHTSPNTKL